MKAVLITLGLSVPASAFALNCAGYQKNIETNYVVQTDKDGKKLPGKLLKPVIDGYKTMKDLEEKSLTAGDRTERMGGGDEGQAGFEDQANQSLDKASGEALDAFCSSLKKVRERAHNDLHWMASEKCDIKKAVAQVKQAFAPLEKAEKTECTKNPSRAFNKKKRK